jgi:hypothetical protein
MKANRKGFFSVIISLFAIAYLLFTVGIPHNTPNYYPEFIVKTETQYLYLNNTVTSLIADFFESNPDCDFSFNEFKTYFELNQDAFCNGFNTDSFKCSVKIKDVTQIVTGGKVIIANLSISDTYTKAGLNFGYNKEFIFSKIFESHIETTTLPDGTEQKVCLYSITDLDSGIKEKDGSK